MIWLRFSLQNISFSLFLIFLGLKLHKFLILSHFVYILGIKKNLRKYTIWSQIGALEHNESKLHKSGLNCGSKPPSMRIYILWRDFSKALCDSFIVNRLITHQQS
jgi:hypothetical protein